MSDDPAEVEREEIEMLLPWYAMGTLDCADTTKVESYLARHPHTSCQLDLIRAEREQAVVANEALGSPSVGALSRLMASLSPGQHLFQRVAEFFTAPTAPEVRWVALAAAALIIVQGAAIASLLMRDAGNTYQTASGPLARDGFSALIAFRDEATAPAIARLLAEFDASIVDGPKPGGIYKIRLRMADRPQSAQDALLRRLAERGDIVRTVLPSRD